jgi:hypothetical protein
VTAAGLMQHIETDECKVITLEVFERRRAEKAVAKDAWAAQVEPDERVPRGNMSTFSDGDTTEYGGVSLIDEDNLLGSTVHENNSQRDYLTPSMNLLSLRDQYPSLPALNNPPTPARSVGHDNGSDLLSFAAGEYGNGKAQSPRAWAAPSPASSTLFKNSGSQPATRNVDVAGGPPTPGSALSADPNTHISTAPAPMIPASILDPMKYYNTLTNKFDCPGRKCGGHFDTIEAFNAHLTSSAHVGGRTVCPLCLRKFPSTMALVAHCESPSKRCNIRNTANYNQILREITGGLLGAEGHHIDGSVRYIANDISKPGFW